MFSWRGRRTGGREAARRAKYRRYLRPRLEALESRLALTTLPAGFTETLLTTAVNLNRPTAMEISPTGQIWALEQGGAVRVINQGTGGASTAGTLTVDSSGERGLLGLAFPSTYDGTGTNADFVYLYYTATTPNTHNRLSRFTVTNAGTTTPTIGSEDIILEIAAEPQGDGSSNHNGGAIHFGADGFLYLAIGDHNADGSSFQGTNHVSQNLNYQHGKLLRIDVNGDAFPADTSRDYAIPVGNPFISSTATWADEIYALGLRNPFTFAMQPGTGRIFVNDVGEGTWEEINDGIAGSNFGWASEGTPDSDGGGPRRAFAEGFVPTAQLPGYLNPPVGTYRDPVMAYDHSSSPPTPSGVAITGGAFYPTGSQFGSAYNGIYFFSDYVGNFIRVFNPASPGSSGTPDTSTDFASGTAFGIVDLKVDSAGNLYYLSGANSTSGEVFRISFNAPSITDQPDSLTVNQGQNATFSVVASGGAPLAYQWQRADSATPTNFSNISGATSASYTLTNAQPADNGDRFLVIVTNSAGSATSSNATLTVSVAGQAPSITTSPSNQSLNAGQSATFSVVASGSTPLSYQWQRADSTTPTSFGNISGATGTSYTLTNAQAVDHNDRFRVVVTNAFGTATSGSALLSVNQYPTASINATATYTFNQTINFSATASDAEDGTLPASAYTWAVNIAHDAHFHPHVTSFSGLTGSSFVANFVEPDPDQFYRILLTVTDSSGATFSTFRDVQPVKVQLSLASNPAGVAFSVDGQPVSGAFDSVVGTARTIQAPSNTTIGGTAYAFQSWSDGGAATHTITTPASNTTYTATYAAAGPPVLAAIGDQTLSGTSPRNVTLSATDPDTPQGSLQFSATATSIAYQLDQQYNLNLDAGGTYQNYGGQNEKWLRQGTSQTWFFILPNGELHQWNNATSQATGPLVGRPGAYYHANLSQLYNATSTPTGTATVQSIGGTPTLVIDPNEGTAGANYSVTVTVSDGTGQDTETINVFVNSSSAGQPPVLTAIGDQTLTGTNPRNVSLSATDPDTAQGSLVFSATATSIAYQLDQQYNLRLNPSGDFFNYGGRNERWLQSGTSNTWYFILPNGELHQWDNTPSTANGPLVGRPGAYYHANLAQLHSASITPPGTATVQPIGGTPTLVIDPNESTAGANYSVTVTVSDGTSQDTETLTVFVNQASAGQPPVLGTIGNRTLTGTAPANITLSATDSDTAQNQLSFSAVGASVAYQLDQQFNLNLHPSGDFFNYGGRNERWMRTGTSNTWYFILPNGELYLWDNVAGSANGTLVGTPGSYYYNNLSQLYNATPAPPASISVQTIGGQPTLVIDPIEGFRGTFLVTVTVSDGNGSDTETIVITVQ